MSGELTPRLASPVVQIAGQGPRLLAAGEAIYDQADVAEGLKKAAAVARKQEREAARQARDAALEAQAAAHGVELKRLDGEIVERERAAHAHGFHKATWMMGVPALIIGALGGVLTVLGVQGVVWTSASTSTREDVLTGAMIERLRGEDASVLERPPPEGER